MLYECTISHVGPAVDALAHEVTAHPSVIATINNRRPHFDQLASNIEYLSAASYSLQCAGHTPQDEQNSEQGLDIEQNSATPLRTMDHITHLTFWVSAPHTHGATYTPWNQDAISAIARQLFPANSYSSNWQLMTIQAMPQPGTSLHSARHSREPAIEQPPAAASHPRPRLQKSKAITRHAHGASNSEIDAKQAEHLAVA